MAICGLNNFWPKGLGDVHNWPHYSGNRTSLVHSISRQMRPSEMYYLRSTRSLFLR